MRVFSAGPTCSPSVPRVSAKLASGPLWGGEEKGWGPTLPALKDKLTISRNWLPQSLGACPSSHPTDCSWTIFLQHSLPLLHSFTHLFHNYLLSIDLIK